MASSVTVPADFICPITSAVMVDPVMDREGNSYEAAAIYQWLEQQQRGGGGGGTSPITRNPLAKEDLVVNRALKNSIDQFLKENLGNRLSVTAPTPPPPPQLDGGRIGPNSSPLMMPPEVKLLRDEDGRFLLSIIPPVAPGSTTTDSTQDRLPIDIIAVIDISGSMQTNATVQNEKNEVESHGLTVFDVVEHATKTVSNLLGPKDRFALVTFNHVATKVLGLTPMDAAGKKKVDEKLKAIQPDGRTNLWGGLETAMDMIKESAAVSDAVRQGGALLEQRTTSIMLLTDGCPNVEPPRGHMPTLKNYLNKLRGSSNPPCFTINTFGFGYSLDSTLLNEIATETGGMYVFIPDSGLVGTVFVNTVANLLVTMSSTVHVTIDAPGPVSHALQLTPTQVGGYGSLGPLLYGQSRDTYFRLDTSAQKGADADDAKNSKVFAKVDLRLNNQKLSITVECQIASLAEAPHLKVHAARSHFCSTLTTTTLKSGTENLAKLTAAVSQVLSSNGCTDSPLLKALLKDIQGEVTMAFSQENLYVKWGKHYVPSLIRANVLQQCNNFKDHSVQLYGGALFSTVQEAGEAAFLALPPPAPKPSPYANMDLGVASSPGGGRGGGRGGIRGGASNLRAQVAPPTRTVNMSSYYNTGGGCISASSLVDMGGGQKPQRACDIKRGDVLSTGATVDCRVEVATVPSLLLVKFAPRGDETNADTTGGLTISPYHPIREEGGSWKFPIDAAADHNNSATTLQDTTTPTLFAFLLKKQEEGTAPGWFCVASVDVVAMAHGMNDTHEGQSVVSHNYFGTDKVRQDLEALPGYGTRGVVQVSSWIRDPETNEVCGLI